MLSTILDVFRLRQYFNAVLAAGDVLGGLREDAGFVNTVRRALISLPLEQVGPSDVHPFPPVVERHLPALEGKRVALIATGGSGALASVTGVWRAFEETGIRPSVVSVCSGSSLFGFPLAAGFSADEVAEFTLSMRGEDYVDINWADLGRAAVSAGRGFGGFIRGEKLEATYRRLFGDMTLSELAVPCYAPIWNIEENRLEYIGPRTHPTLPVARAVRVAVALPLFLDPVRIGDGNWCDGGIVDIFAVHPLLDIEPGADVALAVNGFYPPDFAGESAEGWRDRAGSIFRVASQVRTCQQIELARENLARLRDAMPVLMTNPVPYEVVKGVGFYKQFMDRNDWPEFMRSGHRDTLLALESFGGSRNGSSRASKRTPRSRRTTQTHHPRRRPTPV
jgi:NTE family protein